MMLNRTLITTLLAASFAFAGTSAFAAMITIVNPGFEDGNPGLEKGESGYIDVNDGDLENGEFRYGIPNGWDIYDPEGVFRSSGTSLSPIYPTYPDAGATNFNPNWYNLGTINPDGTYSDPPEGSNVGFVYVLGGISTPNNVDNILDNVVSG